jgi:hypothetical protein
MPSRVGAMLNWAAVPLASAATKMREIAQATDLELRRMHGNRTFWTTRIVSNGLEIRLRGMVEWTLTATVSVCGSKHTAWRPVDPR